MGQGAGSKQKPGCFQAMGQLDSNVTFFPNGSQRVPLDKGADVRGLPRGGEPPVRLHEAAHARAAGGVRMVGTYPQCHAQMLAKVPKNTTKVPKITCSDAGESAQNAAKVGPKITFSMGA